jgi:hypothetical protein
MSNKSLLRKLATIVRTRSLRGPILALVVAAVGATGARAWDGIFHTAVTTYNCASNGHAPTGTGPVCLTDDSTLTWYAQTTISGTAKGQIQTIMNSITYPHTDITVMEQPYPPTYSGPDETDIIYVQSSQVPSSYDGLTMCDDAVNNDRCDQHYVYFRLGLPGLPVVCHETGHAIGLKHGYDSSTGYIIPWNIDNDTLYWQCVEGNCGQYCPLPWPQNTTSCAVSCCERLSMTDTRLGCMRSPWNINYDQFSSDLISQINAIY